MSFGLYEQKMKNICACHVISCNSIILFIKVVECDRLMLVYKIVVSYAFFSL